jgi:hypothetical protein
MLTCIRLVGFLSLMTPTALPAAPIILRCALETTVQSSSEPETRSHDTRYIMLDDKKKHFRFFDPTSRSTESACSGFPCKLGYGADLITLDLEGHEPGFDMTLLLKLDRRTGVFFERTQFKAATPTVVTSSGKCKPFRP